MSGYEILALAAVLVLVYAAFARRLIVMARPLRQRLVCLGEELLSSPDLPPEKRGIIASGLDSSFSAQKAWLIALLITPAWAATLADIVLQKPMPSAAIPSELREKWREFSLLSLVCRLMNSPAALVLTLMQLIPILLTSVSLVAVFEHLFGMVRSTATVWPRFGGSSNTRHA